MRRTTGLMAALILGALMALPVAPRAQSKADVALRAAMETETVKGDLKAAIEQYKAIAAGTDRAAAAKALLRMGQCYEKLGAAEAKEAQKAYELVIAKFADQTESVAEARKHLSTSPTPVDDELVVRKLLSARDDRIYGLSVSQEGRFIAFVNRRRIYLRNLATGDESLLVSPASAEHTLLNPLVAPDGRAVAYADETAADARIQVVGADGFGARTVASRTGALDSVTQLAWSPDGAHLLVWHEFRTAPAGEIKGELRLVSVGGGASTTVLTGEDVKLAAAGFSPDGRRIVFLRFPRRQQDPAIGGLFVLALESREVTPVLPGGMPRTVGAVVWSHDGQRIVFSRLRNMAPRQSYDLCAIRVVGGKPDGDVVVIKKDVPTLLGVTKTGEYLYRAANSTRDLYAVDIDPQTAAATSRPKRLTSMFDNRAGAWSPDGKQLAYVSLREGSAVSIVIRAEPDGREQVFSPTSSPWKYTNNHAPQWFPDGRSLMLHDGSGTLARFLVESGEIQPLLDSKPIGAQDASGSPYPTSVVLAPDGASVFHAILDRSSGEPLIVRRSLDTGATVEVMRLKADKINTLTLSPDGRQLAYVATRGVYPDESESILSLVSAEGGPPRDIHRERGFGFGSVAWSRDGRFLFYRTNVNRFVGTKVIEEGGEIWAISVEGGEPRKLGIGLQDEYFLSVHPDGKQLIFMDENYRNELWSIKNLFPTPKKSK